MFSICIALFRIGTLLKGLRVVVWCDNEPDVLTLRTFRSRGTDIQRLIQLISLLKVQYDIELVPGWIQGKKNTKADDTSRDMSVRELKRKHSMNHYRSMR